MHIQTKGQYEIAFKRLEEIDESTDPEEIKEAEILTKAIVAYEEEHYPM